MMHKPNHCKRCGYPDVYPVYSHSQTMIHPIMWICGGCKQPVGFVTEHEKHPTEYIFVSINELSLHVDTENV